MIGQTTATIDRRTLLVGLGAACATALLPATQCFAATAPFARRIGSIEVTVLSDGALNIPLSFMLPETATEKAAALLTANGLPPGGAPVPTNVTLVKAGGELVLIDAGSGANWQPTAGKLLENLEAAGIDPKTITAVIFTHCHADHLWGVLDDFEDSARFPAARYIVPAQEWDFWSRPDNPVRIPDWLQGMARGSARVLKRIEARVERRKPGDPLVPGLSYVATTGHTPGHMSVMVEDGNERLLVGGDALAHPAISFARPDWRFGSDYDRDQGVATRKRLLDQLAGDRMPMIGFHLPYPGHGVVERNGLAYRFVAL
jgi:glyoxylase-like metal-dependent hydrolase (beta-lactamase superfamily II)